MKNGFYDNIFSMKWNLTGTGAEAYFNFKSTISVSVLAMLGVRTAHYCDKRNGSAEKFCVLLYTNVILSVIDKIKYKIFLFLQLTNRFRPTQKYSFQTIKIWRGGPFKNINKITACASFFFAFSKLNFVAQFLGYRVFVYVKSLWRHGTPNFQVI